MKIKAAAVNATKVHLLLPPIKIGIGPMKMTPVDLSLILDPFCWLKLSSIRMTPKPIRTRPNPRKGKETFNADTPIVELFLGHKLFF
jgi:hypothetical protein